MIWRDGVDSGGSAAEGDHHGRAGAAVSVIGVAGAVEFVQPRWDAVGACGLTSWMAPCSADEAHSSRAFPSARTWMLTPWRLCLPE